MKHAMGMFFAVATAFVFAHAVFGYQLAYEIGYGAITVMSIFISGTFLWLWRARTTPLALGMAFSWAGTASVMGWWWMFNVLDRPAGMVQSEFLFLFLSLHIVGAVLHFGVIQRSMGIARQAFLVPVTLAFAISAGLIALL